MKRKESIILCLIILLGLFLRFNNYDRYPQRGATGDEYTYSFLGVSLLTKGVPISWSYFGGYPNHQDLTIDRMYFPIVWPYFDHPPLAGLAVGAWTLINGQDTFEKIKLSTVRLIPIALSVVFMLLVFFLAKDLYGIGTALLASLIFAVAPIFVIQQRVVLAENFLTPIFLAAVYFYRRFKENLTSRRIIFLGALCGLAFWTKESGITLFFSLFCLSIFDHIKTKRLLFFVLTTSFFIAGYIAYGAFYGADVFWKIVSLQSTRDAGLATLPYILTTPIIINKIFYDGWYFFGLISLGFFLTDYKKHAPVLIPAISYLFFLLFFLTARGQSGWYIIPLFPFFAIASAYILVQSFVKGSWGFLVFLLSVGFPIVHYFYEQNFGLTAGQYRVFLILLVFPWLVASLYNKGKHLLILQKLYCAVFFSVTIYLSYNYIHPA